MTLSDATDPAPSRIDLSHWDDSDMAAVLLDFSRSDASSQRQYASDHGVPRSTLGYWLRKDPPPDVDPSAAAFFRGTAGIAFLRRLVLALFVVFHFRTASGLRSLGLFLKLAGLDWLIATSYGALHDLAGRLEQDLIAVGNDQRRCLARDMPARSIAVCLDENFHRQQPYLVGIEPSSNFLLVETHSPSRDGQTWTTEVRQATADLNVEVVLVCSDRSNGLLACAEHGLNVPHSPDLMHSQRDLQQPMLLPLRRQLDNATAEVLAWQRCVEQWQKKKQAYQAGPRPVGRPPEFDEQIRWAKARLQQAQLHQQGCEERLRQAGEAIREVADEAHPFDSKTGAPLEAKQVGERVDGCLARLEEVVEAAGLGEKANLAVAKGYGWATTLMSLVTWFWALARRRVQEMNLPEAAEQAVYQELLPGLYWQQQTRRGRNAQQKRQRKELAEQLQKHAWRQGGALAALPEETRAEVLRQAKELAGLFVRSSSCVEGRNGRLSLLQHGHVRLSKQTLAAQTVIHNYVVKREDGTTAAERFFGKKPEDMFEALLVRMPNLPRPAAKRPRNDSDSPAQAG